MINILAYDLLKYNFNSSINLLAQVKPRPIVCSGVLPVGRVYISMYPDHRLFLKLHYMQDRRNFAYISPGTNFKAAVQHIHVYVERTPYTI